MSTAASDSGVEKLVEENKREEVKKNEEEKEFDLGLEENPDSVKKPRKRLAKFDEERLISENGIPKLRKMMRKVKLKGKGHEAKDLKQLLGMYHIWTHELYPRATFDDSISYLKTLGKHRSVKVRRRGWINEIAVENGSDSNASLFTGPSSNSLVNLTSGDPYVQDTADDAFVAQDNDTQLE
ncbi:replication fork protection complex subunit Swi3 [Schizosaccharomyces pombe]|uniref:Swi1-interacting protein swi3 n=1 Tax=Schizosaccharomyces pombe (strain 972 / ATCC 24843) TaxID=284812 RepID=SWI3_SCHPO|nr:replication fork protection complex subunit Swi3 [Schizosaccharomyces pombe]O14350.2 RecName: Full=Swi1-interacting protein swi3; AltName: Full=Replication fork protection complex subunit swi3 [Schizosaccharomyces pombe 972h-]AAS77252.1 Swi3 [Schizosaccharomyces pombe]AAT44735.1 Swi3 [Schizosaccharomyces pombe]CAH17997.1 replication fork protection complex subunit Swi3 [Schizosaccharomyces pombe]|eukprot:NP_001018832.1 replication fork protection complex subunit Swi3 [Schizosaccharomyces pombe]